MSTPAKDWDSARLLRETFVRTVEVYDEVTSTSDLARTGAEAPGPGLIIAERQTAGRGRGDRPWWSGEGALLCTLTIDPSQFGLSRSQWTELSLTVGTAVCSALMRQLPASSLGLKWPNDVSLLGRKVCGILVEAVSPPTDPGRTRLLIGIGLNVHNSIRQAPPELQSSAIALCDVVSPAPHRGDVLIDLLQELAVQWDWLVHDPDRVRTLWRRYDVLVGRPVTVGEGEAAVSGTCEGIEDDGALRVRTPSGPQRIYSGTVRACDSGGSQ